MKLEQKIETLLPEGESFEVLAHELWKEPEGWVSNSSWYLARNATREEVFEHARGRWEVFKVNYQPRARVKDLTDNGGGWESVSISVDCIPFLEIRATGNE